MGSAKGIFIIGILLVIVCLLGFIIPLAAFGNLETGEGIAAVTALLSGIGLIAVSKQLES